MDPVCAQLALLMGKLGLLSFGGTAVALAEIQREVVRHGWMTDSQFVEAFALGQITGVGALFAIPVGYQAAGLPGALVALAAYFVPPAAVALLAAWSWQRLRGSPWRPSV
jgi:chromate transporter